MAGNQDILVTDILVIPFIMAILVTIVTPVTMGTWDTRVILITEVWSIRDTIVWNIMNKEIWAIIMVGNSDRYDRKRSSNTADLIVVLLDFLLNATKRHLIYWREKDEEKDVYRYRAAYHTSV